MVCCKTHLNDFSFPPGEDWVTRPWGKYRTHFKSKDSSVCYKTLIVDCGHQISVQYHNKRSEVWYIPDESAQYQLTLAEEKSIIHGQRKIDIPKGYVHSIFNMSSIPLMIYEFQYGFCDEDDIVRLFDPYANQR